MVRTQESKLLTSGARELEEEETRVLQSFERHASSNLRKELSLSFTPSNGHNTS